MIDQNKNQSRFKILVILGALCTIGPFSIDMYLPAFSEIAKDLHTDVAKVSLSVSSYFIGLAVGQILYGPLLDRFGRRPPLFFGLTLYLLSSLVCMSAKSVELLIAFRFIQAIGGCSAQVASTAMVRDFFPVKDAARIFSALFLMISVSPLIAPSVGSFVVIAMGWQAVFGLLALIVFLITLATYFFLPEGHLPDPSVSFNPKLIFKDMVLIFKHPQFFRYALAGSFSFAGLFVYVTGSPSIFIDTFHLSKKAYGGVFALLSVGFIGGSQFNNFLTRKFSNEKIFEYTLYSQTMIGAAFFLASYFGFCNLETTIFFLFIFLTGAGISYPNAAAIAITPFSKNAGRASALLGLLQMGIGALMSAGVGVFAFSGILPTVIILSATSFVGLAFLIYGKKKKIILL